MLWIRAHRGYLKGSQMTCDEPFGFFIVSTVGCLPGSMPKPSCGEYSCGANANYGSNANWCIDCQKRCQRRRWFSRKYYALVMQDGLRFSHECKHNGIRLAPSLVSLWPIKRTRSSWWHPFVWLSFHWLIFGQNACLLPGFLRNLRMCCAGGDLTHCINHC